MTTLPRRSGKVSWDSHAVQPRRRCRAPVPHRLRRLPEYERSTPDQNARSGNVEGILGAAERWRRQITGDLHEHVVEAIYEDAARIADRAVTRPGAKARPTFDRALDKILTSRLWGFPIMILLFALMFWLTIAGANVPSGWLATLLIDKLWPILREGANSLGSPWWLTGLLVDGVYLATAWVVSVMLPPMAIFFPLFTLLEDFGYLPRIAFNLDKMFKQAGAHGKQAMSMMMGFGCNAAGVVATRIIDSPRERLIAILTNNFALCNGRWPTQILVASLFIGSLAPAAHCRVGRRRSGGWRGAARRLLPSWFPGPCRAPC